LSRDDSNYLRYLQDAISTIRLIADEVDFDHFREDRKTQGAIFWYLHVVGESVRNLTDSLKSEYPAVPWRDVVDFRNALVHHYFGINYKLVWDIIHTDLIEFEDSLKPILLSEVFGFDKSDPTE
jgi:uncharacterized protein with HEPN domain